MSAPFKAGDRAYCAQPQSSGGGLAHGALYFVTRAKFTPDIVHPCGRREPGEQYLQLLGDDPDSAWNASRFKRVDCQDRLWPLPGAFDKWEDGE